MSKTQKRSGVVRCQRCLKYGHYTYECANEVAYRYRPSRTVMYKQNIQVQLNTQKPPQTKRVWDGDQKRVIVEDRPSSDEEGRPMVLEQEESEQAQLRDASPELESAAPEKMDNTVLAKETKLQADQPTKVETIAPKAPEVRKGTNESSAAVESTHVTRPPPKEQPQKEVIVESKKQLIATPVAASAKILEAVPQQQKVVKKKQESSKSSSSSQSSSSSSSASDDDSSDSEESSNSGSSSSAVDSDSSDDKKKKRKKSPSPEKNRRRKDRSRSRDRNYRR